MSEEQKKHNKIIPRIKMVGKTNDNDESVPPQKKGQIAPLAETDEMAVVDAKQPMLSREEQAINHFNRTTDEIMVIIIIILAQLQLCVQR